jgi:pimeloyl-ACP methyl ester carboxylesterase
MLQEKVGQPVYIAGNSLGGYLGVHLAAKHPSAVAGLILLNATPFWSQRPPLGKENLLWMLLKKDLDAAVPVTTVRTCVVLAAKPASPLGSANHTQQPPLFDTQTFNQTLLPLLLRHTRSTTTPTNAPGL